VSGNYGRASGGYGRGASGHCPLHPVSRAAVSMDQ